MAKNIDSQVARLFRIITILTSSKDTERITRPQLADLIGCSEKTVQRDINHLKEANVPIEYNDKLRTYILFNKDWTYPVVKLTPTDVLALGLVRAWIANANSAFPYSSQISEALKKTTSCLTPELMKGFNSVGEYLTESGGTARKYSEAPIGLLLQASMEKRTVEVDYESRSTQRGVFRRRRIDPYRLDRREGQFYDLQGFCHEHQEMRTFSPDRMRNLEITDDIFKEHSLGLEDKGVVGGIRSKQKIAVEVRFDDTVAPYAMERGWTIEPTFKSDPDHPGSITMQGEAQGAASLAKEILRWGRHAKVIGGPELRQAIEDEIDAIAEIYGRPISVIAQK